MKYLLSVTCSSPFSDSLQSCELITQEETNCCRLSNSEGDMEDGGKQLLEVKTFFKRDEAAARRRCCRLHT